MPRVRLARENEFQERLFRTGTFIPYFRVGAFEDDDDDEDGAAIFLQSF